MRCKPWGDLPSQRCPLFATPEVSAAAQELARLFMYLHFVFAFAFSRLGVLNLHRSYRSRKVAPEEIREDWRCDDIDVVIYYTP
jgi:hypothetical protein